MLLGFKIGQRWPEAVMHSCGSCFVPVPKYVLFRFKGGYLFVDEGTGISDPDNAWKTETSIRVDF